MLHKPAHKVIRRRRRQVKLQARQHAQLHISQLIGRINRIANKDKVFHVRRVDFLELAGDHERGDAHELAHAARDAHARQESVQVIHRQVKRLVFQAVLIADLDEPVNENAAHFGVELWLLAHVILARAQAALQLNKHGLAFHKVFLRGVGVGEGVRARARGGPLDGQIQIAWVEGGGAGGAARVGRGYERALLRGGGRHGRFGHGDIGIVRILGRRVVGSRGGGRFLKLL